MNYFHWLMVLGVVAVGSTASSCRSAKKIQSAITKKDTTVMVAVPNPKADSSRYTQEIFDTIQKKRITGFQTLSAKVKVDYRGSTGRKPDFTANVQLLKDSIIWISVNVPIIGEAMRAMVTRDSVKVMNKLGEKTVQLRSIEYLQEVTKIPFTFNELQDLLIGNPIYLDSNIVSYKNEEKSVSLVSVGALFKHLLTVNRVDYTLEHSKLDDVDVLRARTCDITYSDYEMKNGINFSKYRKIVVSEKNTLEIELQFKQFEFNKQLSFPFNIPKNYKRL